MVMGKMPRSFWSYTAGKGDVEAEEREAKEAASQESPREFKEILIGPSRLYERLNAEASE